MDKISFKELYKNKLYLQHKFIVPLLLLLYSSILLLLSNFVSLHPDVADHWVWSRTLFLSYYEHPPMLAWLVSFFTFIFPFNNIPFALFLGSTISFSTFLLVCYLYAKYLYGKNTALLYMIFFMLMPYITPGGLFLSTNIIMLILWVMGLFILSVTIRTMNPNWLLLFGIVAGLGGLTKYIYLFLCISFILFIIFDKKYWIFFKSYQLYLMPIIALIVFSPVIIWNIQNDFASFLFEFQKGFARNETDIFHIEKFLGFTVGHLFLFSPILTTYSWYLFFRGKLKFEQKDIEKLIIISTIFSFIIFNLSAMFGSKTTDPNWVDISYIGLTLLVAKYVSNNAKIIKNLIYSMLFFVVIVTLFILSFFHIYIPNYSNQNIQYNVLNSIMWHVTGKQIDEKTKEKLGFVPKYVFTRRYQTAGALALYMPSHPISYSFGKDIRNQWVVKEDVLKNGLLLVCEPELCANNITELKYDFNMEKNIYLFDDTTYYKNAVIRTYKVYYYPPIK